MWPPGQIEPLVFVIGFSFLSSVIVSKLPRTQKPPQEVLKGFCPVLPPAHLLVQSLKFPRLRETRERAQVKLLNDLSIRPTGLQQVLQPPLGIGQLGRVSLAGQ